MADKELAKVRSQFVDKVSKEVISQLLDNLLEDGIINEGEKDGVLEENKSRVEKARNLIDVVKKKGEYASSRMIIHLKSLDPTLHAALGLPVM